MTNPMDLTGKAILVTGASSGLGRSTAILASRLGARVVLSGRNEDELARTAAMLEGPTHEVAPLDLTASLDAVPAWVKLLATRMGGLHGLVHSAGIQSMRPLRLLDSATLEAVLRINVGAAVALARGFRQKGVAVAGGSLVLLSSVMGLVGQPAVSAYCASKGAIVTLTKSLALELARDNLRVNCVAPGQVRSEMGDRLRDALPEEQFAAIEAMHPLGFGEPDDVANAIAFLLSGASRWITGSVLVVDGGYTAH